ncbi:unnamed protein product [Adineta steineri]|uniref:DUF2059 domain-containing protein n=1 Tax=Adineta steineri TaxID=433720 RepID=A0A816AH43_9BILA|nr:unnamed protein product [Adineta steineri]CAF1598047.1 unnamed protein product [Adineta steineri]
MSIRLYCLIVIAVSFIPIEGKPVVDPKLTQRINRLLNITEAEKKFNTVLEAYITSDATFASYKSEILKLINNLYTLVDINGLIEFYSSPLGKKLIVKEGQADVRLAQLVQNKFQSQMPQIMLSFQQMFANPNQTIH